MLTESTHCLCCTQKMHVLWNYHCWKDFIILILRFFPFSFVLLESCLSVCLQPPVASTYFYRSTDKIYLNILFYDISYRSSSSEYQLTVHRWFSAHCCNRNRICSINIAEKYKPQNTFTLLHKYTCANYSNNWKLSTNWYSTQLTLESLQLYLFSSANVFFGFRINEQSLQWMKSYFWIFVWQKGYRNIELVLGLMVWKWIKERKRRNEYSAFFPTILFNSKKHYQLSNTHFSILLMMTLSKLV